MEMVPTTNSPPMPTEREMGRRAEYNTNELGPQTAWEQVQEKADGVRDFLADTCCRCLYKVPSLALIVLAVILLVLLLAIIPAIFALTYSAPEALVVDAGRGLAPVRIGASSDSDTYFPDTDPELDPSKSDEYTLASVAPNNTKNCDGYGFSCTSRPDIVIGTNQRCDGVAQCPDGSDEDNCRECHTAFSCAIVGPANMRLCLRSEQLCDDIPNCADASDEDFCGKKCNAEELECKRGSLTVCARRCDGEEYCSDGSDEAECSECSNGAFFCKADRKCLPKWQICDGKMDCSNGADEKECDCRDCSGTDRALMLVDSEDSDDENVRGLCVARDSLCNGIVELPEGLDEEGCPGTCPATVEDDIVECSGGLRLPLRAACSGLEPLCAFACQDWCDSETAFQCNDKKCISRQKVCDGNEDCQGGEDEDEKKCKRCDVEKGDFKCLSGPKCIRREQRCDGIPDCDDFSDEQQCEKCSKGSFFCAKDNTCHPMLARCDGEEDCTDASDEEGCSCEECKKTMLDPYMCGVSQRCFARSGVCSPLSRCPNATHEDKRFCAAQVKPRSE